MNINNIKNRKAIGILENYNGKNPYIVKLKNILKKNGGLNLTNTQIKYIIDNHDKQPIFINKILTITKFFGDELRKNYGLSFTPERILVEYILGETDKSYHILGKLKRNQRYLKDYFIPKTQLIDDPFYEKIEIDVDWDKYKKIDKFELSDGTIGRTPYEYQKEGIKFLLSNKGCILADEMGLGKAEYVNNRLFTPNGRKRIGDIKPGDYVISPNGKKVLVKNVYPQGKKKLFNIKFNDNTNLIVCDEHLFTFINDEFNGDKLTIPIKELINKDKILFNDTEISTSFKDVKWKIPITNPVIFENVEKLKIGGYLFAISLLQTSNIYKGIPNKYKYNNINVRLDVLRGIFDKIGIPLFNGDYFNGLYFTTKSKKLFDDICEIVNSLGGVIYIKIYNNKYGGVVKLPKEFIPFNELLKDHNIIFSDDYKIERYIVDIEYVKDDYAVCIEIDSMDSLYLTEYAIVTHNTYQSIIAALESGAEKVLIVCPSSVKINWQREIEYFQCYDTAIIEGKRWKDAKFTIINYDILKNFHTIPGVTDKDLKKDDICMDSQYLVNGNFDLCIIDEAHKLKDPKSIRGAIMRDLCVNYGIERVWLLTGTPVLNRPIDYFNLLKLIKAPIADNYKFFVQRYCDGKLIPTKYKNKNGKSKKVWIANGASNLEELALKTKNLYLRRLKSDVLDLPPKTIVPMFYKFNRRQLNDYENIWEDYLIQRKSENKIGKPRRELVELMLLRKFVAMEMIPNTIELADNIIENGGKVIIFCNFTDELFEFEKYYKDKCVIHYGEMNDVEKQKSIDLFQKDDRKKVFIGNIISAGVGITLTSASYVIFNSFDWVPGNNEQAEDRCYRIGKKDPVTIYYQMFENSVSTIMWYVVKRKKNVIKTIMGENDIDEESAINIMLNKIIDDYEKN